MRKATFDELCKSIRQAWSQKDGVIVRLNRGDHGVHELLLCAGGHRNPDFCARKCVVWEGDSLVYDGPLLSEDLKRLLTSHHVCFGELTNAKLMEHEKKGIFKCYKNPACCKSTTCTLRGKETFQIVEDCTAVNV